LQHLALPTFQVMKVADHFAKLLHHTARGDQKELSGLGQRYWCTRSVNQGQSQALLQAANTSAERRLSHEAALGRLGKTMGGSQGNKIF